MTKPELKLQLILSKGEMQRAQAERDRLKATVEELVEASANVLDTAASLDSLAVLRDVMERAKHE